MRMTRKARLAGNIMLFLAALFWGIAFVVQKDGGTAVGPWTFNGVRSLMGALVLYLSTFLLDRMGVSHRPETPQQKKDLWIGGLICGVALFAGTNLQQLGINLSSPGKSGFITSLYIVLVPFFSLIFGNRLRWINWAGIALAVAGLYMLCLADEGFSGFGAGDWLLIGCAFGFSVQIITVSRIIHKVDGVRLSCVQFLVVGILNIPVMLLAEPGRVTNLSLLADNWISLAYAGILSSGAAYTLQILGQKYTDATSATLLMSLESVIATVAGWGIPALILLFDPTSQEWIKMAEESQMTVFQLLGCVLMFAAVILSQIQLPEKKKRRTL